ncbi:MAG: hypothetical protein R3B09_20825 [Nannocystaceae bacterium]
MKRPLFTLFTLFTPFLALVGCDASTPAHQQVVDEVAAVRSCFGDVDPARYAAEATEQLRSAAEPDHPACAGEGNAIDEAILCDAVVEARVDEHGTSVKLSRAVYALPPGSELLREIDVDVGGFTADGSDPVATSIEVTCKLDCKGTACEQSGCFPGSTGCGMWNCGPGCSGTCSQSVKLIQETQPKKQ